jgi:hypothetical protein
VERAVASKLGENNFINLELNTADFATASRVVEAINDKYGPGIAYALDSRVIRVQSPSSSDQRVAFIGTLQDMQAVLRNSRPSHHECAHRLGGDEPAPSRSIPAPFRTATCRCRCRPNRR